MNLISLIILLIMPAGLLSANTRSVWKIEHKGLDKTDKYTVDYYLLNRIGSPFSEELWMLEKNALMDLDIFADVELQRDDSGDDTTLIYSYKELPSYLLFPAMKRTDQDGLLMGPGITFTNIFGKGIHQELMGRVTVVPDILRAKELLSYTRIPDVYGVMFDTEITVNYFKSYNALKLYNENSLYSLADFNYRFKKYYHVIGSLSSLNVKHDPEVSAFTAEGDSINMYRGKGRWDFIPGAGAGFAVDTREKVMNPHRGVYT